MPHPFRRDTHALTSRPFDLLVVGGGIYGLTVAADAAQRGLSVALIERSDFGSGTSFNHLRTIHGGLRYLQTLDLARARESVRERRTLARIAPWSVAPLPFVLPLFRSFTKGPTAMRLGFMLDQLVASDRNDGLPASHHLPAGLVLSRQAAHERYPALHGMDIVGAAVWHDYVTTEADRLTLAWGLAAADAGACLANYVEAVSVRRSVGSSDPATPEPVFTVLAEDRVGGPPLRIIARTVVNASGGALNHLLAPSGAQVQLPLMQAVNLVTRHPAPRAAIGGRSASGRNLFLVPWKGRALFGTWESPTTCQPGDLTINESHLASFVAELNQAFPTFPLTLADVTLVHRGVVPAKVRGGLPPTLDGGELVFEHAAQGLSGLVSVAGTKYTTARAVAERIVDRLFVLLERPVVDCLSAETPLPHVALEGDDLLRHAAANEMVMTLSDAVMRRTPLGALGKPDEASLQHAAQVVGTELGWTPERQREEMASCRAAHA